LRARLRTPDHRRQRRGRGRGGPPRTSAHLRSALGQFEDALARWLGAEYASACSSGTAALHLAYAALGIGEGDEIITTPITFSATAAAAYYVGATVRIADVDPRTGNLIRSPSRR
jgi:dTDP-4-amino-4,6-dideoxygalactose transaminase